MSLDFLAGFEAYLSGTSLMAYVMAYFAGLMVSFTPCIYPMIPVTVAYIASQSSGSRIRGFILSLFYVLGTSFTYTVMGYAAAVSGQLFGQIQTSPWTYFFVANICILMGLSMLGVFTLPLPRLLSDRPARPGRGLLGAFVLGASVGLILGPCSAPVLGVLLGYVATQQNPLFGTSLLFVFALGWEPFSSPWARSRVFSPIFPGRENGWSSSRRRSAGRSLHWVSIFSSLRGSS